MILFYLLAVLLCVSVLREWSSGSQVALTGMVFGYLIHLFDDALAKTITKWLKER